MKSKGQYGFQARSGLTPTPIRDVGPTMRETERLPFLEMLSGYDRARVTIYAWWTR